MVSAEEARIGGGCRVSVSHADSEQYLQCGLQPSDGSLRGEPVTSASESSLYPTRPIYCPPGCRTVFCVLIFYPFLLVYKILHPSSFYQENTTTFNNNNNKKLTVKKTEDNKTNKTPKKQQKGLKIQKLLPWQTFVGFFAFLFPF